MSSLCLYVVLGMALAAVPSFARGQDAPTTPPPAQPEPKGIPVPDGPSINTLQLEGGLIIEDIKIGDGYQVQPGGAVVAHYHGTLKADGKVFDSSFERGEAIAFPLSGVIAGWQKGVPGMKVGGIRRLTIPAALGYGERGAGGVIPPNADLVFIIQLEDALQVEDVKVGEGEAVSGQCVAVTTYTISDENGKVLEQTEEGAPPTIWFPNEYQPLAFGLDGMKPGGERKITAPKGMNPKNPNTTHPTDQKVVMTVKLIAARNLQQRR